MPEKPMGCETAVITVGRHNHNGDTRSDENFAAFPEMAWCGQPYLSPAGEAGHGASYAQHRVGLPGYQKHRYQD